MKSALPGEPKIDDHEVRAFLQMRAIENVIRELIVEQLSASFGPKWYKTNVPDDIRQKFTGAIVIERRYTWIRLVPYHPIYYVDFPDLKKIIERGDNWKKVFQPLFGSRKDVIAAVLSELEPIRNSIAHNRGLSLSSVNIVVDASDRVKTVLGERRFDTLLARSTTAPDLHESLGHLRKEGEVAADRMTQCERAVVLDQWQWTKNQWWFDEIYIGSNLTAVRELFEVAEQYLSLPRLMGDGYRVERWLASRKFKDLSAAYRASWTFLDEPGNHR